MKVGQMRQQRSFPSLPAFQPLTVQIDEVEYRESSRFTHKEPVLNPDGSQAIDPSTGAPLMAEAKNKEVRVTMRVVEGPFAGDGTDANPPGKLWGTHSFTVGKKGSGDPSMLRALVQAVHDRDLTDEELLDFDIDNLKGRRVIVIGKYRDDDTERQYLRPMAYDRVTPAQAQANRVAQAQGAGAPAPAAPADDYQYQEQAGIRYRWKPGMAGWEPVPTPAVSAPPPLPVAPAGPPPLPAQAAPAAPTAPPAPPAAASRADF